MSSGNTFRLSNTVFGIVSFLVSLTLEPRFFLGVAEAVRVERGRNVLRSRSTSAQTDDEAAPLLDQLREALERKDGKAVFSLTEALRNEVPSAVPEEKQPKEADSASAAAVPLLSLARSLQRSTGSSAQLAVGSAAQAPPVAGSALFDDQLFALDPVQKAELAQQLQDPRYKNALESVQKAGWYNCAMENEKCLCAGEVRYGNPHAGKYSQPQQVASEVMCTYTVFGDPLPGKAKECECHRTGAFHLKKQLTSESVLQESWIMLLRVMAKAGLLPTGTGDRKFHGIELWSARKWGQPGGCLERFWIDKFLYNAVAHAPGPKCLEWGPMHYSFQFPQCSQKYEVQYEKALYGQKQKGLEGNVVYSDILSFPWVFWKAGLKVNFILATQLFEHLEKPYEGAKALFDILEPGGMVVFTAPQQAQFHMVPGDFLRYTKMEVKYLFESQGFCVPPSLMSGAGDYIFDIARDSGLQVQDFTVEEMEEAYYQGYDNIPDGVITVNAMAIKPPHAFCPKSPAAIATPR